MATLEKLSDKRARITCDCGAIHELSQDANTRDLKLESFQPKRKTNDDKGKKKSGGIFDFGPDEDD